MFLFLTIILLLYPKIYLCIMNQEYVQVKNELHVHWWLDSLALDNGFVLALWIEFWKWKLKSHTKKRQRASEHNPDPHNPETKR